MRGAGGLRGGISPVAFHALITATLSGVTGVASIGMSPNNSNLSGLNEIADQFDLYRFARLRYRIHPMDPTDTTNQVMVYYPDADIQVQTTTQAAESPLAAVQTPFCGVPSRWITVPPSQLKGLLDWYKCTADSGATEFELQGLIQLIGGLSDTTRVEIEGVIHFKNPVSSALQVERLLDRLVAQGKVVRVPGHPESSTDPEIKPRAAPAPPTRR